VKGGKFGLDCPPSLFIFSHDFRRIIKTRREETARPGQEGESLGSIRR